MTEPSTLARRKQRLRTRAFRLLEKQLREQEIAMKPRRRRVRRRRKSGPAAAPL